MRRTTTPPRPLPALVLLLALCAAPMPVLAQSATSNVPDPGCKLGQLKDGACCPRACAPCGGDGCAEAGGRLWTDCCPNSILSRDRVCDATGAPCKLAPAAPAPPPPPPPGGAPDRACPSGVAGGGACCKKVCGTCGGGDCWTKAQALGTRCCPDGILRNERSCDETGPPCVLTSTPPPPPPDPVCAAGVAGGGACCKKVCGTCGGADCWTKAQALGTRCCPDGILRNERSCDVAGAPCVLPNKPTPPPPTSPPPKPMSPLVGAWRHAPVASGSMLRRRHEACAVMARGKLVLLGGRGANIPVNVYDPVTKKWSVRGGVGEGRQLHHFQCVEAGGLVWVVSSWGGSFPFETNNAEVLSYDVVLDRWASHTGLPESRRRGGAAAVRRGDLIFVVGGNRGGHGGHATSFGWVDAYNWRTDTWLPPRWADLPGARDHVVGALVRGRVCVGGGRNGGEKGFWFKNFRSTYCLDVASGQWKRHDDLPDGEQRAGAMAATACDGSMVLAGGEGNGKAYRSVHVFDGEGWIAAPSLLAPRHGSGLAVADCASCGHMFIPSGSGAQGGSPELPSTEEFIPAGAPSNCPKY